MLRPESSQRWVTVVEVIALLGISLLYGMMIVESSALAIFGLFGLAVTLLVWNSPLRVLAIFMVLIPYSSTPFFLGTVIDLPGAKPLQLLAVFIAGISVLNYPSGAKWPRFGLYWGLTVFVVFTVAVIRSVENITMIGFVKQDITSVPSYFTSVYVKPLIYFIPLFVVMKFAKSIRDIDFVFRLMTVSLACLSLYVIYTYIVDVPDKTNIRVVIETVSDALGMHKNAMSTFFIIGTPIVLARYFLVRDPLAIVSIALSVVAIGFLYSRTAYVTLLGSFVLYLWISKRGKMLPVFLGAVALLVIVFAETSVVERAQTNLDTGDVEAISAGRVDKLWEPVVEEYLGHPGDIITGKGRFAMLTTKAAAFGFILGADHPHNMYLEVILDSGVIGLAIVLVLYAMLLRRLYKAAKETQDKRIREFLFATFVSVVAYLVAGLTGRTFFPEIQNCYLWAIIGTGFALLRLSGQKEEGREERS